MSDRVVFSVRNAAPDRKPALVDYPPDGPCECAGEFVRADSAPFDETVRILSRGHMVDAVRLQPRYDTIRIDVTYFGEADVTDDNVASLVELSGYYGCGPTWTVRLQHV